MSVPPKNLHYFLNFHFCDKPTSRNENASSLVENDALDRSTVVQSEGNFICSGVDHHDTFVVAAGCYDVCRDW
jgi:hypothetical protein